VVLIHHPPLPGQAPPRRALRDAEALERVLATCGAELVLHGHNHRDNHIDFAWSRGRIPVLGVASGSVGRVHKGEPLGRYNLLRITRTGGAARIECTTRGLDATGSFIEQVDRKLIA
jgi:3',5'-cyclic AMP phosphodiesterase CpdA